MQCVLNIGWWKPSEVKAPRPPQDEIPHGEQPMNASPSLADKADKADNALRGIEELRCEVNQLRSHLQDSHAQNAVDAQSLDLRLKEMQQRLRRLEDEVQARAAVAPAAAEAEAPGAQATSHHWDGLLNGT